LAEKTGISWARSTFNCWIGCTKVGPGCDHCYAEALAEHNKPEDLPLGQILAVAEIIGCRRTEHAQVTEQERAFGDYTPGRYAIFTAGVRRLKQPITIRGALSIWRLPAPLLEGHDF